MSFAYLSMAGMQIQVNQFGLDGSGVKALLLGILGLVYRRRILPAAARYVDGRREVLVQA